MSQLPMIATAPVAPGLLADDLHRRLHIALNKIERDGRDLVIRSDNAISSDLRASLERRRRRLDECMKPIGNRDAAAQIMALRSCGLKMAQRSEAEHGIRLDATVKAVAELPGFAVIAACEDYQQGRAGDGWMPQPGDLRKLAESKVVPAAKERREINDVLTAKVMTIKSDPERKKRLLEVAKKLPAEMELNGLRAERARTGRNFDPSPEPEPELPHDPAAREAETVRQLEALKEKYPGPPQLSDELEAKMGIRPDYPDDYAGPDRESAA